MTSENGPIGRLFLTLPPLSEIAKKLGKMLKYTPTFKVLSAPLCTVNTAQCSRTMHTGLYTVHYTVYTMQTLWMSLS